MKFYDLTKVNVPFGLLDKDTQNALRAHGGPYELFGLHGEWIELDPVFGPDKTYRVKPQPTVETIGIDVAIMDNGLIVAREIDGITAQPVRVTFTRTNGVIDLDSYKVEAR